ncbi:MAG: hypothetical protein ACLQU1_26595, partial [Bryobacteraceae bacterium]
MHPRAGIVGAWRTPRSARQQPQETPEQATGLLARGSTLPARGRMALSRSARPAAAPKQSSSSAASDKSCGPSSDVQQQLC